MSTRKGGRWLGTFSATLYIEWQAAIYSCMQISSESSSRALSKGSTRTLHLSSSTPLALVVERVVTDQGFFAAAAVYVL